MLDKTSLLATLSRLSECKATRLMKFDLLAADRDRRGAELAGGRPGRVVNHAIPAAELTGSILVLWCLMAVAGRVVSWWRFEGRSGGLAMLFDCG
ncbi:hypothetical protein H112_08120 [Trichophyton rubrum D6]|uniref:Uncharacterized protein n=2 Tax=Trichophyton TaxID=5550 RepID=A0A022VR47_TRIRU|nr:hypothetical protein H100_08148 [Trichophyton rubrum MR850]EZF37524.1 hypothetical protein H102_08104 [Trichophyton rubrum CBS 100081]EZF48218.1 hypothetical protein H103_08132 [Trichophyton rubrum CBS 288.86]EZF58815.1 hypothetical protein H104_08079 [Trichophyton rubrum CBS 289.86]EZF69472.1 hypothetical protein H105_08131 [Trichophyton soudanense CBS 452.61]EZF80126.1 hypothetical protein H110_08133 [Trichophyton rubrum MR1448]EZF90734.1 hypothetical protein H113_08195 [Trichophyton rub